MIRVVFQKPTPSQDFDDWVRRCSAAAVKLRSAAEVKESLYKEQREAMLDLFNRKCAYCEATITLDQHAGDVEHYRPKGGVTDENDVRIKVRSGEGGLKAHPGYYWLAYDPLNLLPSCIACNRPNKVGNRRVGKWNRFPVAGKHAISPEEVAAEKPLLLNPLVPADDPALHIDFDSTTGRLIPKTERGRTTIELLNLNREGLPEDRRQAYDNVLARALEAFTQRDQAIRARAMEMLEEQRTGKARYSIAGRLAIERHRAALAEHANWLDGLDVVVPQL